MEASKKILNRKARICRLGNFNARRIYGFADDRPVSHEYRENVLTQRKILIRNLTKAERAFDADVCRRFLRLKVNCRLQTVFFATDQVSFIADFYFPQFGVIVEIDGTSHRTKRSRTYDKWRDGLFLEHLGIVTLRFTNKQVLESSGTVFAAILEYFQTHGNPSRHNRRILDYAIANDRS